MSEFAEKLDAVVTAETLILNPASPYKTAEKYLQLRCHTTQGFDRLIRYRGDFYVWTGTHYRELSAEAMAADVYKFLDLAKQLKPVKGSQTVTELVPFSPNSIKVNEVAKALASRALVDDHLEAPAWRPGGIGDCLYRARDMLACRNGLLHLPSRYLADPTPEFMTFNAIDFDYDPNAPEPVEWLKFLATLWPDDPESIATLQEIFGYMLSGDLSQQKLFMLVGPKRAGKGTIARVLRQLLGERNVVGPTLRSLSENFGLEHLIGKRLAIIGDARIGGGSDQNVVVERLLSISGEDALSVSRKFKAAWDGILGVRVMLLSNELPRFTDASATIASRFVILKFENSFYGREDHGLEARIMSELPGILNWALEGLDRLNARGHFVIPASANATVEAMEELSSPLLAFVNERCEVGCDKKVSVDDMFQAWSCWCAARNLHYGSAISFSAQLHAAVPTVKTGRLQWKNRSQSRPGRAFFGIGLRCN